MGDWIWVLITALITFFGISLINVNPVDEPTQFFLDFQEEKAQTEEEAAFSQFVKESIWQSGETEPRAVRPIDSAPGSSSIPEETSPALVAQIDMMKEQVGKVNIPWALVLIIPLALVGIRVARAIRAPITNISSSPSAKSAA